MLLVLNNSCFKDGNLHEAKKFLKKRILVREVRKLGFPVFKPFYLPEEHI